jgi:DNA repair protein RadC
VREAVGHSGAAVVCLHNHPSKVASEPSEPDRDLTNRLREALRHEGIQLLDHLIVAGRSGHAFSFAEEHLPVLSTPWSHDVPLDHPNNGVKVLYR